MATSLQGHQTAFEGDRKGYKKKQEGPGLTQDMFLPEAEQAMKPVPGIAQSRINRLFIFIAAWCFASSSVFTLFTSWIPGYLIRCGWFWVVLACGW